jgi:hypothetical protein
MVFYYLVSIQKWAFSTISALTCEVGCATYWMYASAQPLAFLDLAENYSFVNWKLDSVCFQFLDGHYLVANEALRSNRPLRSS